MQTRCFAITALPRKLITLCISFTQRNSATFYRRFQPMATSTANSRHLRARQVLHCRLMAISSRLWTRRAFRAKTDGATGTGTGNLSFDGAKKPFPSSGYLRIGDEFIGYTGISSSAFTGITRGALGSAIVNHADEHWYFVSSTRYFQSAIFCNSTHKRDTSRLANVIRDGESRFEARDDTSIDTYDEQPYPLNLGLTQNEDAWIETIFAEYLSELKDLGKAVSLRLPPRKKSFALMLGQVIGVRYSGLTYALRVESVSHQSTGINIKVRSVATTL